MEGLVLLREQASTSARYWLCAACDRKFHTAGDFAAHLEACHEQLVLMKQPGQQQQLQQQSGQLQATVPVADAASVPIVQQQQLPPPPPPPQQQQLAGSAAPGGLSYITCSKCQVGMVLHASAQVYLHARFDDNQGMQYRGMCLQYGV